MFCNVIANFLDWLEDLSNWLEEKYFVNVAAIYVIWSKNYNIEDNAYYYIKNIS